MSGVISQSFLTPNVADYRVMALLSCTHSLFSVHACAGNKAEIDLTDIHIYHRDITKRTLAQQNLQFEDKVKMFHTGR